MGNRSSGSDPLKTGPARLRGTATLCSLNGAERVFQTATMLNVITEMECINEARIDAVV